MGQTRFNHIQRKSQTTLRTSLREQVCNITATVHQLILTTQFLTYWLLRRLVHVTSTTNATSYRKITRVTEVHTKVSYLLTRLIKVTISWDVTTCIILEIYQCFKRPSVSDLKVGNVSEFLRNVSINLINTFQEDKAVNFGTVCEFMRLIWFVWSDLVLKWSEVKWSETRCSSWG